MYKIVFFKTVHSQQFLEIHKEQIVYMLFLRYYTFVKGNIIAMYLINNMLSLFVYMRDTANSSLFILWYC